MKFLCVSPKWVFYWFLLSHTQVVQCPLPSPTLAPNIGTFCNLLLWSFPSFSTIVASPVVSTSASVAGAFVDGKSTLWIICANVPKCSKPLSLCKCWKISFSSCLGEVSFLFNWQYSLYAEKSV